MKRRRLVERLRHPHQCLRCSISEARLLSLHVIDETIRDRTTPISRLTFPSFNTSSSTRHSPLARVCWLAKKSSSFPSPCQSNR